MKENRRRRNQEKCSTGNSTIRFSDPYYFYALGISASAIIKKGRCTPPYYWLWLFKNCQINTPYFADNLDPVNSFLPGVWAN